MKSNDKVIVTVRDNFSYTVRRSLQRTAYRLFGPVAMAKVYYKIVMKKKLNLKEPSTFTEKINWYKLYYCPKNPLIIQCCDKFGVRKHLTEIGLGNYLSTLIGAWDTPEEINWSELPERFALKNSNGCGYNIICRDKAALDEKEAKKLLKKWMRDSFGCYNAEPHYNLGQKKVICEEFIDSGTRLPDDYKIHCMNGEPKVIQVCDDRTSKTTRYTYFDTCGKPLAYGKFPSKKDIDITPEQLTEMLEVSKRAAKEFPYVRVDFFVNHGHLQISELTFTPSAGLKPDLVYGGGDLEMGKMLDIEQLVANNDKKN